MTGVHSTDIDIPTEDGVADACLTHPGDGRPRPAVLFYMDAFGLRPQLRSMADRLAGAGYTVLVPNLFYRHGRAPVVELPEFIDDASRDALFQEILPMMRVLTPEVAMRDAGAYLRRLAELPEVADGPVAVTGYCFGARLSLLTAGAYPDRVAAAAGFHGGRLATDAPGLAELPEVADGPVAVTGYCFGARLSLLTAGAYPDRVAAAAGFHGGRLATDAPDSPHLVADRITAELYFGHADHDPSLPPEQVQRLEDALTKAGVRHRCEVYPDAPHGFTQADTTSYRAEGDKRHWTALLDLLQRSF